jgi:hypothetical protein
MDVSGDPSQGVCIYGMSETKEECSFKRRHRNAGVHYSHYLMTCRGCPQSISLLPTSSNSDAAETAPTLNGKCAPPDQLDRALECSTHADTCRHVTVPDNYYKR